MGMTTGTLRKGTGQQRTSKESNRRRALLCAVLPLTAAMAGGASAAERFFDGDGVAPVNVGSGPWDASSPKWATTDAGTLYGPWDSGASDTAVFNGGGAVSILGSVFAGGLDFRGGSYGLSNLGGSLTLDNAAAAPVINVGAGSAAHFFQDTAGSTGFTKTGLGTVYMYQDITAAGPVTISQGTVRFAQSDADFKNAHAMTIEAGGTWDMGVVNDGVGSLAGAGTVKFAPIPNGGASAGPQLTVGADDSSTTFSGVLQGEAGQFFKTGSGTMTLSGANTFQGRVAVQGGNLRVQGGQAIGDRSDVFFSPTAATVATNGVSLELLSDERVGSLGSAASAASGGTNAVIIGNGFALTIGSDTANVQFNGRITGTGTKLIKVGSGIQQFATGGAASTYTGGTEIRGGQLIVSSDAKLGAASGGITLDGGVLANFNTVNLTHNRAFTVGTNGGGIQVNLNPASNSSQLSITVNGVVSGPGILTKRGTGRLSLSNSNNAFAGLTVNEGSVGSAAAGGTPMGTGPVRINAGELVFAPTNVTNNVNVTIASAPGATLSYGDGARLQVNRNNNTSFTLTVGDAAAASSSLVRLPNGSLEIIPAGNVANLGNANAANFERVIVNGGVPVRNGIVDPSIVSWTSAGGTGGEFLTYDGSGTNGNGFQLATYTGSDLNAAAPTDVVKTTAAQVLTADRAVYALHTGHSVGGAQALRVGDGTGTAGLILNVGGSINTSALTFDGDGAAIYTQNTATGVIDAPVTITRGGLNKMGLGTVRLNQPATYTGPTVIGSGTLSLGGNDILPTSTSVRFGGVNTIDTSNTNVVNLRLALALNGNQQTVAELSSPNHVASVDLGGGKLTVNQATDTVYQGRIVGGGTFEKAGPGKLVIQPNDANTNGDGVFASAYDKLIVSGGVLETANSVSAFPVLPADFLADHVTLSNGGTLRWANLPTLTTTQVTSTTINARRGLTLGAGGGVIDVVSPYEILLWQFAQGTEVGGVTISGDGGLTKKGAGILRLGAGNTYKGKTVVLESALQFTNDTALGEAPATFVADHLTIDNGAMIESNGSGWIAQTRGVRIGAGGAVVSTKSGNYTFNSVVSGPGTITRYGNSTGTEAIFNAANNTFAGIVLKQGQTFFNGQESAGAGTIVIDPITRVTFGKNQGPDNTISNPIQLGEGAAIDIRVRTVTPTNVTTIFADITPGTLTLAGKISGPGLLSKGLGITAPNGDGTVILTNPANDFTNDFTVSLGTVQLNASGTLGATSGATIVNFEGTLALNNVQYAAPERLVLAGKGFGEGGALVGSAGASRFAGPVALAEDANVGVATGASLELAGALTGTSTLNKVGEGRLTLSGANGRLGGVTVSAGALEFNADHTLSGTLTVVPGATAKVTTGRRVLRTAGIDLGSVASPSSSLDLTDGALIVDYTDTSPGLAVKSLVQAAYGTANPRWAGTGITSSTAAAQPNEYGIGFAEAAQVVALANGTGTFLGQTVDETTYVARVTLLGDATLDGTVDFTDLVRLAQNYEAPSGGEWFNGDFNYDGTVDFSDLVPLAQNYETSLPAAAQLAQFGPGFEADFARALSAVPEPGSVALVALTGAAAALRRRRRSQA
jgi:autotransporter-associated beta strand protein